MKKGDGGIFQSTIEITHTGHLKNASVPFFSVPFFLIVAFVTLLLGSCSSGSSMPDDGTSETTVEAALLTAIGDGPGGLSVALRRNGETQYATAGIADIEENAILQSSIFRVGSITKPIVATMVMQLVEEGQIELDSNLGAYLPNTTVGFNATIRNLLSHRAGIASYTNVPGFFDDVYSNPSYEYTPNDMLNYVVNDPVDTSGRFAYSNTHYILLGQLIEALDGGDLSASLQRRITDPLNLDSTSFVIRDAQRPESMVPAWSLPEFEGNFDRPYTSISSGAWAAGALASNVTDLETFLDALLDGTLVQPATLDQMRQFGPEGYGLGIFELNGDSGSVGIWHSGVIPGYNSIMAMTSDRETAVVVLSNNARMDVAAVADYLIEITAPQ